MVTGVNGFIGTALVRKLLANQCQVVGVDIQSETWVQDRNFIYLNQDLSKEDFNFDKFEITKVVHCAAQTSVQQSIEYPVNDLTQNAIVSIRLFEACLNSGVENVVYLNSGGAMYGELKDAPFKESDAVNPVSPYAISKYSAEMYGRVLFGDSKVHFTSLALGNVYGNISDNPKGIFYEIFKAFQSSRKFSLYGPDSLRDYVHVEDVVKAILLATKTTGIERFNISSGVGTKNSLVIEMFREIIDSSLDIDMFEIRRGDLRASTLDVSKAEKLLGWKPEISLRDSFNSIFEF